MQKKYIKLAIVIVVGLVVYFLLGRFLSVRIFTNTYLSFQFAFLAALAYVFGPLAGGVVGLAGQLLVDMTMGVNLLMQLGWVFAAGFVGFAIGFLNKRNMINVGEFTRKEILRFCLTSSLAHAVAWFGIAPGLDVLLFREPAAFVFKQGLYAGLANSITTLVLGTILLFIYSKFQLKTDR